MGWEISSRPESLTPKLKQEITKMFTLEDAIEMRELAEKLDAALTAANEHGKKNGGFKINIRNPLVDAIHGMGTALEALEELELVMANYDKPEDWSQ